MIYATVLLGLVATTAAAEAQNTPISRSRFPRSGAPHSSRSRQGVRTSDDDLADLKYTDDQKTKIDEIHKNMKARMDVVVKDEASTGMQKQAMLEGLARVERRQVLQVLTPEQLEEVRRKALARRAAEQQQKLPTALKSTQAQPLTSSQPSTTAAPPAQELRPSQAQQPAQEH